MGVPSFVAMRSNCRSQSAGDTFSVPGTETSLRGAKNGLKERPLQLGGAGRMVQGHPPLGVVQDGQIDLGLPDPLNYPAS